MRAKAFAKILIWLIAIGALAFCFVACKDEPPHVHAFDDWQVTLAPTCTQAGERVRTCACGDEERDVIAPTAHIPGEWQTVTAPTCIDDGTRHQNCTACGVLAYEQSTPALGHDEQAHEAKAPTCNEIGWESYVTCSRWE